MNKLNIPKNSILGINYSGMHDSAISIVSKEGKIIYSASLERFSRYKQDGRFPEMLLEKIDWDKIDEIAISTEERLKDLGLTESKLHPIKYSTKKTIGIPHGQTFYDFINKLPKKVNYVCHQLSHASSTFWLSGLESSLCLCYDGGMYNSPWFGGLYLAEKENGIKPLDRFALSSHPRITVLYSAVTALLGFTPNKHEGKITGLAAYGSINNECLSLLKDYLSDNISELDALFDWYFIYENQRLPSLIVNEARLKSFQTKFSKFSKEDIAATVQNLAEHHILEILRNAIKNGWHHENICLAGGLFSNVKLNQKIKKLGFKNIFICPAMTDDGTAIGAALEILHKGKDFSPSKIDSMSLGCSYGKNEIEEILEQRNIKYLVLDSPEKIIAEKINNNNIVAVFIDKMEFGPRSLGNRSILASASNYNINTKLNNLLNRTEFMPFAPMTRYEDACLCYEDISGAEHTAEFMTITMDCRDIMKKECPAVVHVDGTARPQIVKEENFPFLHKLLTNYKALSGKLAIVNTSFNIHEEPIVRTVDDAIDSFLESGLDYLYLHPGILLAFDDNKEIALKHLQEKRKVESKKTSYLSNLKDELFERLERMLLINSELKEYALSLEKQIGHVEK